MRKAHYDEAVKFFKTFPDNHIVNNPYKIAFGQGDWTCTIADFTGTMKGPMKGAMGKLFRQITRNLKLNSALWHIGRMARFSRNDSFTT
jgi:hypothetical protein